MAPSLGAPVPMAPSFGAAPPMPPAFGAPPPLPGAPGLGKGAPGPPVARKPAFAKKTMTEKVTYPKTKMKTLHWKPINDKKIQGTIWEDVTKLEDETVKKNAKIAFFAPKKVEKKPKEDDDDKK